MRTRTFGIAVAATLATLVGCGGGDETGGPAAAVGAPPVATDPSAAGPASTTGPAPAGTDRAGTGDPAPGWERVVPGGDCQCADGSEFGFWVREADPARVVLYFQGGGACFSAETCSFTGGTYTVTADADDVPGDGGVFDAADERNPFAGHSVVFVPYCTGDVHIGDATTEYAPDLTVQHKGFVNGEAALEHLLVTFPDATDVVVMGESAGSVPSPLYAGLIADRLPTASITVLADGSGAYPDVPAVNELIGGLWGSAAAMPDWPVNAGLTPADWSFPGLFVQAGRHDPRIVFARHDYAYDETQEFFAALAGLPGDDLVELIDANEAQIEAAGVPLLSYVAPGDEHTVLHTDRFYTEEVNGVRLVDWVTMLISGEPVDDVHCTDCER